MLNIKNLSKRFGHKVIVDNLCLDFPIGCHRIEGHNGTGKSTLLLLIAGLIRPDKGEVFLSDGVEAEKPFCLSEVGSYVPDKPEFYPFMKGSEYINFVCKARQHQQADIEKYIESLFLAEHLELRFSEMSLGTRKKLFLAVGLSLNSKIILLDEPTVGLDKSSIVNLEKSLGELGKDKIILLSTHNQQFLKDTAISTLTLTGNGNFQFNSNN